jgi:hypothetical protein
MMLKHFLIISMQMVIEFLMTVLSALVSLWGPLRVPELEFY